jgi:RNA-dependent RNA polymerase
MDAATIREKLVSHAGHVSRTIYRLGDLAQGDLTPLAREPARLAARWAQAFSATDPSITLQETQIERIEDRISADGSVFTDGCGKISPEMSRTVWGRLRRQRARYSKSKAVPSCFQFRLGGAKGVLVQDPTLSAIGKVICLRPSQEKFEAPDVLTLDIQSTSSRPKAMFLNRPLIVLLEHLGVDPSSIITLQDAAIRNVQSLRTSLSRASELFMQHGLGSSFHLPSLFNNIVKVLGLDIDDQSSPGFFRHKLIEDALYCAATHALREIKYRSHILVPDSVTLLGVSDEWDCLEEGEIYATVHDERTSQTEAIIGRVLVTRSPQVHPGDVQFVTAVRRPELSHLTNVVVFSCK